MFYNVSEYLEIIKEKGNPNQIVKVQIIEMEETHNEIDEFVDFGTSKDAHVKLKPLPIWETLRKVILTYRKRG